MADQKIDIQFQVLESKNPQFLLVADLSEWSYAETLPSFVWITLPGSSKAKQYSWKKDAINAFNSNNFGITCLVECGDQKYTDVPDGIYTVCLKSGYEDIEKTHYYLKTDRLEVELSKTIIRDGIEEDKNFIDTIFNIKWYLLKAKSYAHVGNFTEAQRYYEESKKMFKKYADCTDCF